DTQPLFYGEHLLQRQVKVVQSWCNEKILAGLQSEAARPGRGKTGGIQAVIGALGIGVGIAPWDNRDSSRFGIGTSQQGRAGTQQYRNAGEGDVTGAASGDVKARR